MNAVGYKTDVNKEKKQIFKIVQGYLRITKRL